MTGISRRRATGRGALAPTSWNLRHLLDRYKESHGLERLIVMGQLREYMKSVPQLTILEEINPLNDTDELNILLGVGLRGMLYYAVVAKKIETGNV